MCTQQVMDINENIGDRGLSIIEVVFALSIFAIGILAVTTLSISAVNSNASARRLTDATTLAEDRLERLAALPYDDIDPMRRRKVPIVLTGMLTRTSLRKPNPSPLRWNAPMAGRIRRLPSGI